MSIAKNIQSTTLELTPRQAREMALLCFADHRNALWSLADQVEALTKERDECRRQSDLQMNSAIKFCQERNAARIERDALAAAAKLAFKALCRINDAPINLEHGERLSLAKAIVALRQAGVQ